MKPLGGVNQRYGLKCHQYAGATQLYLSFSSNPECLKNYGRRFATLYKRQKKKCKKAKWLTEEALQIAEERREAKGKGERERYRQLNAEFQRIARRYKNAFLNEQCKEIEENNRIGRTRDLFKKIGDMKGTFHAKMGMIKEQNGRDLTEAEVIKKRWQDYTEELYKKDLNIPDNHDGVGADLEPDILECEVQWALGSLSNNKASGGDSIPAELFQILKDNAVKMLHSICQQIWKTQQWPQDWKTLVYIPIPQKGDAKNVQITAPLHSFHMLAKLCSKSYKLGSSCMWTENYQKYRQGFEEAEELEIKWPTYIGSWRKPEKNIYFCFTDYAKAFDCVDHNKLWQVLKEMGVPDHLICPLRNLYVGQEATVRTGHGTTDWLKIEKGVWQGFLLSPCLFNLYAERIMRKVGLDESQVGIKIAGRNIHNLRYADGTTLMAESEEKEPLDAERFIENCESFWLCSKEKDLELLRGRFISISPLYHWLNAIFILTTSKINDRCHDHDCGTDAVKIPTSKRDPPCPLEQLVRCTLLDDLDSHMYHDLTTRSFKIGTEP
ncbi:hypothetical protein EYD10_10057 [Varanus komodoensis]|nr:hypothetical protein EYD10_10057 [Varanus komodoensis]